MAIKNSKDKMVRPADSLQKSDSKEEYHFAGEGIYKPLTVRASNQQEANELWEAQREEINQ